MKTYDEAVHHYADLYYTLWMNGSNWITMPELNGVCFVYQKNFQEVYNDVKRLAKKKINTQAR